MVLRLGHAQTAEEAGEVWLALNLLIPVGLQMGGDEATNGSSVQGSVISSVKLIRSNAQAPHTSAICTRDLGEISDDLGDISAQVREYIDANFHMLIQFLRNKLSARAALISEKVRFN